jgi:hypothetical protein
MATGKCDAMTDIIYHSNVYVARQMLSPEERRRMFAKLDVPRLLATFRFDPLKHEAHLNSI